MKTKRFTRSALAMVLSLGGFLPASARFQDWLPADTFLLVELPNMPAAREAWLRSPVGAAIDTAGLMQTFRQMAEMEEAEMAELMKSYMEDGETYTPEPSSTLSKAETEQLANLMSDLVKQMNGQVAFVMNDMGEALRISKEIAKETEALDAAEVADDDESAWQKQSEAYERLEARDSHAIASTFLLLAEVRGTESEVLNDLHTFILAQIGKDKDALVELKKKEIAGATVHYLDESPGDDEDDIKAAKALEPFLVSPHWTVSDGLLVVAMTEAGLRNALTWRANAPSENLAGHSAYIDSMRFQDTPSFHLYCNLRNMDAWFRQGLEDKEKNLEPGELSPTKLMNWLGLDALLPVSVGMTMHDEGWRIRSRMGFSRDTSLSRILFQFKDLPPHRPSFVHKDVVGASVFHYSLAGMYDELEKSLPALSPQAGMGLGMGRAFLTGQLGLDVKTAILDNLDSRVIFLQQQDLKAMTDAVEAAAKEDEGEEVDMEMDPFEGSRYVFGFGLKNEDAVRGALNTILAKVHTEGLPKPEVFMGEEILNPLAAPGNEEMDFFTIAFIDGYLLLGLGDADILRNAVRAKKSEDLRLWNSDAFRRAEAKTDGDGYGFEFANLAAQLKQIDIFEKFLEIAQKENAGALDMPNLKPLKEALDVSRVVSRIEGNVITSDGWVLFPVKTP